MRRVGILLAGCGIYDGSEAQETVLLILALSRRGLRLVFLAPDADQRDVVDHSTGATEEGVPARSVLKESARLTRGTIVALHEIVPTEIDALVIPGGMGVVKNLCAAEGARVGGGAPRPEVRALLDSLRDRRAPVAALGLGEVVLARHQERPLGHEPVTVPATEVRVDEERRTLFTPGFMGTGDLEEVAVGVERLAERLAGWLGASRSLRVGGSPGRGPGDLHEK